MDFKKQETNTEEREINVCGMFVSKCKICNKKKDKKKNEEEEKKTQEKKTI